MAFRFGWFMAAIITAVTFAGPASAQCYDRWCVNTAEQALNRAAASFTALGSATCWEAPQICTDIEWAFDEADDHLLNVFNSALTGYDAYGRSCWLLDPSNAQAQAFRLKEMGETLRAFGGTKYWGYPADTFLSWTGTAYCPSVIGGGTGTGSGTGTGTGSGTGGGGGGGGTGTGGGIMPAPGPERCLIDSIAIDAWLNGVSSWGAGPTYPMKGDIACTPNGYWRVTRSEITKYNCDRDFIVCHQTEFVPIIRTDVEENATLYFVTDREFWKKTF